MAEHAEASETQATMRDRLHAVQHKQPFRYEEDGLSITRGSAWSAPGCHLGCGVLLYSDGDTVVRVEGDEDNPYNQGRLCVRCLAAIETFNNPARILYPLRRSRADRGRDVFERISWDEAMDTITERFTHYRETYGAQTVTFWQGTGRDIAAYISRLAWSFGSPNYFFSLSSVSCYGPRIFACNMMSGSFWVGDYSQQFTDRYDNAQWEPPEVILIWGNDPIVANSDGAFGHWVTDCMQRGSKIVTVDPRCTWLAANSEHWLQVRPGSDGALALGLANVIISEGLYDADFVDRWTYGFDEFAAYAAQFTPEETSRITWVPAEKIRAAARLLASSKNALLQWGVALDQRQDCVDGARAVFALMILTGNIDKPGSMVVPPELLKYITGWGNEFLPAEQREKKLGNQHPFFKVALACASTSDCIETLLSGEPYELKAAWIQTVNELACGGVETEKTLAAFRNLEFIVVVDLFMTPTVMALADIVLPVTTFAERNGIRCGDGTQRAETINRAVAPAGECKSDQEICLELGRRLAPEAWPWQNVEEMFSFILSETGLDFYEVQEQAPLYLPFEYYKYEKGGLRPDGQPGFATPTGRLEFYSNILAQFGANPLPEYIEPPLTPLSRPDLYERYPLVLTTGARRWNTFHSEHRNAPHLRAIHPEPAVQMHPQTAAALGVKDGEWVWVEGPCGTQGEVGRARRVVETTPIIDPRVVSSDHGWWHPEGDPEALYDVVELNINNLVSWELGKTGIGANYKCLLCRIYKDEEGARV
jgi:anaerobic selenocysteine-containing dehydrogenase